MKRIVLSLLAGSLLCGCPTLRDRDTKRAFVDALVPLLEADRAVLTPARTGDDAFALFDGAIKLAVAMPEKDRNEDTVHIHVRATIADREPTPFDFCLFGAKAEDAAQVFYHHALPPLASLHLHRPVLNATRFWSTSRVGVPGSSGYVALTLTRGEFGSYPLFTVGTFGEAPAVPRDGHPHLLKSVITNVKGEWRRTLELDGSNAIESDRALAKGAPGFGMLVSFAVLDAAVDPLEDMSARDRAKSELAHHPPWLPDAAQCPIDPPPAAFGTRTWDDEGGRGGRLLVAVHDCAQGAENQCYAAAQELLHESQTSTYSQALFIRACQLGDASGCTNAAAARKDASDCSVRTWELSCTKGQDPWGCTMFGMALWQGTIVKQDRDRARSVFNIACLRGEEDPACQVGRQMMAAERER